MRSNLIKDKLEPLLLQVTTWDHDCIIAFVRDVKSWIATYGMLLTFSDNYHWFIKIIEDVRDNLTDAAAMIILSFIKSKKRNLQETCIEYMLELLNHGANSYLFHKTFAKFYVDQTRAQLFRVGFWEPINFRRFLRFALVYTSKCSIAGIEQG